MADDVIVVTGATGNVGSELVPRLVAAGASARAVHRDPAAADLPAGVEVVRGDLLDPATLDDAFAGAGAVFLLWPSTSAAAAGPAVDATARPARRAGVPSALRRPQE